METDTALVRTDGIVELNAVADVYLYLTLVIYPGYTECEYTIRLYDTLDDTVLFELKILVVKSWAL